MLIMILTFMLEEQSYTTSFGRFGILNSVSNNKNNIRYEIHLNDRPNYKKILNEGVIHQKFMALYL